MRNKYHFMLITLLCLSANAETIKMDGLKYGVTIESSRVIYPLNGPGVSLSVVNPQNYPVLVQTRILTEEKGEAGPFFVTPPLFRLDAGQRHTLRVNQTGGNFPQDRESLLWACVKGIPPKADDLWADNNAVKEGEEKDIGIRLNISIDNCIKFIVRPEKITGNLADSARDILWTISDGALVAYNSSAFYMNIGKLSFNGVDFVPDYIPPRGQRRFRLKNTPPKSGTVSWNIIDDYGAFSQIHSAKVSPDNK
ncbi:molecular chaperone [Salmonella enterica subsp. enterica serovar Muenchen]|uniref:Molecular chaperone n=1 Tax=Salmonella enteritidis TaxID=149539 RepID=A0A6X7PIF6_SALEN|nr:molecular chaperone [Salmonella enterica]ECD5989860.1 molecular chaperone [Salmonella enterica subsp. enterica serovar Muenchen]EDF1299258.1 fimbria/pilus periplasmic chaperone [Salmonella enterica subsp. enterica serovar Enteritidis]EJV6191771.1 molecular chaperone [Salmonella enterica]HAB1256684.1 molecular chaperone [Salmonella enterica subsp. enterica serovar Enteritidis]